MPTSSDKQISTAKLWMVLVGVNHYQDGFIPNLKYCADDCKELAEALTLATKQFKEIEIIALHDQGIKPNLEEVINSIKKFRLAQPEDTILFYFSGHGELDRDNRPVLGITDTKVIKNETDNSLSFDPETGLKLDRLLEEFRNSPAQSQLIWLDACQAKAVINGEQNNANGQIIAVLNQESQQTRPGKNFFAMLSCDQTERSWEFDELGHGLFTYSLIKGLQGNAANTEGKIGVNSLFNYVKNNIAEYLKLKKHPVTTEAANNSAKGLVIKPTKQVKRFPLDVYQNPRKIDSSGEVDLIIGAVAPANSRKALICDRLSSSLTDIEFCRLLQDRGGFTVEHCFLEAKTEKNLAEAIAGYLQDKDNETVLLYLAGEIENSDETHSKQSLQSPASQDDGTNSAVRRKAQDKGLVRMYAHQDSDRAEYSLAVNPKSKVNLNWLGQLIRDSPVKEAIVIVDVVEQQDNYPDIRDLLNPDANRCLCIIAASSIKADRKLIAQLVEILTVAAEADQQFWAATLITQLQKKADFPQELRLQKAGLYSSSTAMNILLPKSRRSNKQTYDLNICPYKSLQAFTQDDSYFFHGREALIAEIIEKLATNSFLAVVGASGSGKSSVVRAGVVPQLTAEGLYSPQSDEYLACKTYVMRPGDNPLTALAIALAANDPELAEGFLHRGVQSFVSWLQQQPQTISVLVIDQFEELFTTKHKSQSNNFIEFILQAIALFPDCFKVIITLRDDFLKDCLANQNIDPLFRQSHILVRPYLKEDEYRQILKQPAQKVGLTIEDELVNVLLQELQTESLPLLQFALDELWRKRTLGKLTLANYQENIGGLRAILGKKAEITLNGLNKEQQECAQAIFQDLVQLGEGKEDTRRRVSKRKLAKTKHQAVFDSTLKALVDARLLVIGLDNNTFADNAPNTESENQSRDGETTVEIAHEILIRNWDTLRWWLDTNRNQIRLTRELEQKAEEWVNTPKDKKDDFLLSDAELAKYQELYLKYADELSTNSNQFVDISIQTRDKAKKLAKRRQRQIISGLTGGIVAISMVAIAALWQLRRATINEIDALSNSAEALLVSNQELDALITGLKAGRKIDDSFFRINTRIKIKLTDRLNNILYEVREFNRLQGITLAFSPKDKLIATAALDRTVKLWNLEGDLLQTLQEFKKNAKSVKFSPNGQIIATIEWDNTIKLWNLEGDLLQTLQGYTNFINRTYFTIVFSPNGQTIASASDDNTVKLWDIKGNLLQTLQGHAGIVNSAVFSPDGQIIASTSWDNTIKLWNLNGDLLLNLKVNTGNLQGIEFSLDGQIIASTNSGDTVQLWKLKNILASKFKSHTSSIISIEFSPDGQIIASASLDRTIKLWDLKGNLLQTLQGHRGSIKKIKFSPNGKMLASASDDKTIKLWNLNGEVLQTFKGHKSGINSVGFSPNGKIIASASDDKTIKLWNLNGEVLQTFKGHKFGVNSVGFSPNGQHLISSGQDETIRFWNLEGNLIRTINVLSVVNDVKFSADGKIIASAINDGTVKIWDFEGNIVKIFHGHSNSVNGVEFSADGKNIASSSFDGTVKLWNLEGDVLHTFQGNTRYLRSATFSTDGKNIASASKNTIKIWSLNLDDVMVQGCNWVTSYLASKPNKSNVLSNYFLTEEDRQICDLYNSE